MPDLLLNKTKSVVLIVGLDPSRELPLIAALQHHGYEALTVLNGFEALQVAIDRKVDLLLTKDDLPGLTGHELIEVVRKHHTIKICILISESNQTPAGCRELIGAKADFLAAPFGVKELLIKIREILPALSEEREEKAGAADPF